MRVIKAWLIKASELFWIFLTFLILGVFMVAGWLNNRFVGLLIGFLIGFIASVPVLGLVLTFYEMNESLNMLRQRVRKGYTDVASR